MAILHPRTHRTTLAFTNDHGFIRVYKNGKFGLPTFIIIYVSIFNLKIVIVKQHTTTHTMLIKEFFVKTDIT